MKITDILFEKKYNSELLCIPISDLPKELLIPGNDIMIKVHEGFNDSNGWNEGETYVRISQYREQTQEEKEKWKKRFETLKLERKEERRKQYLQLKKEFENE